MLRAQPTDGRKDGPVAMYPTFYQKRGYTQKPRHPHVLPISSYNYRGVVDEVFIRWHDTYISAYYFRCNHQPYNCSA